MGKQLHKRYTDEQVKDILERYLELHIREEQAIILLGVSRRRFYDLLKRYKASPIDFTIKYSRDHSNNNLMIDAEKKMLSELKKDQKIIERRDTPVKIYNYTYIKNILEEKHGIKVSLPTIIARAKKYGFYKVKKNVKHMIVK